MIYIYLILYILIIINRTNPTNYSYEINSIIIHFFIKNENIYIYIYII